MTKLQRRVHIAAEAAGLLVAAPFLWHLSKKPALSRLERTGLQVVAVGTAAVDAWLLSRFLSRRYSRNDA